MAYPPISKEEHAFIDHKCDAFESAWAAGTPITIESLLEQSPEAWLPNLIVELVALEIELRSARGESPRLSEFTERFPTFREKLSSKLATGFWSSGNQQHGSSSRPSVSATAPLIDSRERSSSAHGQLAVRCPSCGSQTTVEVDTASTELTCQTCGTHFSLIDQASDTRAASPLSTLGRFELVERIGIGGFGSVWKARDSSLDRTVAIKIPRELGMSAAEQDRFFREARAAAQLRHPNIVSVYEVGRHEDHIFIVSAFIHGITLGDWLTGQKLTSREAAQLCATIADALHHAHEHGVIHRDLKPANIMIDGDGEPHLMDFGLARRDIGEVTVTVDGQILGTPAYMSPEQAKGEAHIADRRSDVYSLGVILFQLLTGELPFRGNVRMLLHQVIHDYPPGPRQLNSNISKDLETISLKCLEKDPASRYQSAAEVAADLRRFLAGQQIQARPIGALQRSARWIKARPTLATLLALLTVVALLGPTVATREAALRRRSETAESEARQAQQDSQVAAHRAEVEAAKSRDLADVIGAEYVFAQGRLHDVYQKISTAATKEPRLEYGRILEDVVQAARRDWRLLEHIPYSTAPEWGCFVGVGPKWFIVARGSIVEVRSLICDKPAVVKQLSAHYHAPCAIGNETLAVATDINTIELWHVPDLNLVKSCEFPGNVVEIRSTPDGTHFVALNNRGLVRVYDGTGTELTSREFATEKKDLATFPSIDISPSGKCIALYLGNYASRKTRWFWERKTDEVETFSSEANTFRFVDDDVAYGVIPTKYILAIADVFHSDRPFWRDDEHSLYTDPAVLYGAAQKKSHPDLALLCRTAIHMISDLQAHQKMSLKVTRYDSLWPQSAESPRFLAYDAASHTLALTAGNDVIVFSMWLRGDDITSSVASTDIGLTERIRATSTNNIVIGAGNLVTSCDLTTLESRHFHVTSPGDRFSISRVAATPDGKRIAVLWFRIPDYQKIVQMYDLPDAVDSKIVPLKQFELPGPKEFYLTGELLLSPDAEVCTWCDHSGNIDGHSADGKTKFHFQAASAPIYAISDELPLVGVGSREVAGNYHVLNASTGEIIRSFQLPSPVRQAAFAPDNQSIYIGLNSNRLFQYRLTDGQCIRELSTPIAPVAVAKTGGHFIGFVSEADRLGRMVLADLSIGDERGVINPKAFVLDDARFSHDGSSIAYVVGKGKQCKLLTKLSLEQVAKELARPSVDSRIAMISKDLLDYRERMARLDTLRDSPFPFPRDGSDASAMAKYYERALRPVIELADDYPDVEKYKDAIGVLVSAMQSELQTADSDTVESIWRTLVDTFPCLRQYR